MQAPPVQISDGADAKAMTLSLADRRYLFEAPAIDPLAGSHLGVSGLDAMLARLKRRKLPKAERLALEIRVPADQADPPAQAQLREALSAHLAARIASEGDNLHFLRRETAQSLRVGGLFLIVCLILSAIVDQLTILPVFAQTLLRESLVIAGWVGLWHPLDLILYGWWPNRYRIGLLQHLQSAQVRIIAQG